MTSGFTDGCEFGSKLVYSVGMANVTVKDINDSDLDGVARQAAALGMSTQEFLRRLIARQAALPTLPDELAELAREVRATRQPMSMDEYERVRRRALRSA
jgi:phage FluMu protein gp41